MKTSSQYIDKPSKVARIHFESDQSDEDDNRSEVGVSDKYETDLKRKGRRRILSDSSDDDVM